MKRRAFNIAAGVSLLVLAAALVEWYRGYHHQDLWYVQRVVGASDNPLEQAIGVRTAVGAIEFGTSTSGYDEVVAKQTGRNRTTWLKDLGKGWSTHINISTNWAGYPDFQYLDTEKDIIHRHLFGFHAWSYEEKELTPMHGSELLIPTWFVVACASILPGAWLLKMRKEIRSKRRLASGRCSSCGYDLRATSDRCPECGTIPTAAKGAAT